MKSFLALLIAGLAVSASAQPYDLTLYNSGFAVVKDTRSMTLSAGMNRIDLTGLPQSLDPNSLFPQFNGTVGVIALRMEQPNTASILSSRVGKKVTLIGADHTFTGVVERFQVGLLILKLNDGSLLTVQNPGSFHLSVDSLPAVFGSYPMIRAELIARRAGKQDVSLFYKAGGFHWAASYVVVLDENGSAGRFSGMARIENSTGMDFKGSTLRLVAGDIYRNRGDQDERPLLMQMAAMAERVSSDMKLGQESVGDVHVYTLDKPFDVMNGMQTRIPLMEDTAVKPARRYRYTANGSGDGLFAGSRAQVIYDIPNTPAAGLGKPLPAGDVTVYMRSGERLTLTGETRIGHISVGGRVRLVTGTAFDILVNEQGMRQDRIRDNVYDNHYAVSVKNTKREAIVVEVAMPLSPNTSITRSTVPAVMEGGVALFNVSLKPGEEKSVEFTVRNSY